MAISFACDCGKTLEVPEAYAGQEGECPSCRRAVTIPALADEHLTTVPSVRLPPAEVAERSPPPRIPEAPADSQPRDHAGNPLGGECDFFVKPPPEIGKIQTAWSTLTRDKDPMNPTTRLLVAFGAAIAGNIIAAAAAHLLFGAAPLTLIAAVAGIAIGGGGAWFFTRFQHTCTYVGDLGVAKAVCTREREHIASEEVFLFQEAVELRTSQTRNYVNGAYTGTNYGYIWSDRDGRAIYSLSGTYRSEQGNPAASDPFHFAQSAEIGWTMYLLANIDLLTQDGNLFYFGLVGGDYLEMGPNLLILHVNGKAARLEAQDIAKMEIQNGVISIWETGAKKGWFSSTGITSFQYAQLGNARFFFLACDKLLGIRF